ncbi:MAG TPA: NAD(P)H-binding protein [Streptomyces sp.]|nr:NAD(P)H-binding protein [Streptomyces sp.]
MSAGNGSSVLVTGGTCTLGRAVVARLREGERTVRVLSRRERPADGTAVDGSVPEWAVGDLTTGEGLAAAVTGVGSIVHCATSGTRKDIEGTRRLTEEVRRAGGNPHLVYISIVGVDRVPLFYYRAKLEAERIIQDSGLPWTVLRSTQFHELIARITTAQRRLPVAFFPAGFSFQPIEVSEVAERLVELCRGAPAGRVADMGGPEVRTARELAQLTLRAYGLRRPVLPVPLLGRTAQGFRAGYHTSPDHAVGRVPYTEYLEAAAARPAGQ